MKKIVLLWVWVFLLGGGVSAWAQENAGDGEKTAKGFSIARRVNPGYIREYEHPTLPLNIPEYVRREPAYAPENELDPWLIMYYDPEYYLEYLEKIPVRTLAQRYQLLILWQLYKPEKISSPEYREMAAAAHNETAEYLAGDNWQAAWRKEEYDKLIQGDFQKCYADMTCLLKAVPYWMDAEDPMWVILPCDLAKKHGLIYYFDIAGGGHGAQTLMISTCPVDRKYDFPRELGDYVDMSEREKMANCSGSIRFVYYAKAYVHALDIQYQPSFDEKAEDWRAFPYTEWAVQSYYNFRKFNSVLNYGIGYRKAVDMLQEHYAGVFGVSSERALNAALNVLNPPSSEYFKRIAPDNVNYLLLTGAPWAEIEKRLPDDVSPMKLLDLSIAYPENLRRLIALGQQRQQTDVDETNDFGKTPLQTAAQYGYLESVRILLAAGADINHRTDDGNCVHDTDDDCIRNGKRTALMYALQEGQYEVAKYLLDNGADISLLDSQAKSAFDYLIGRAPKFSTQNRMTIVGGTASSRDFDEEVSRFTPEQEEELKKRLFVQSHRQLADMLAGEWEPDWQGTGDVFKGKMTIRANADAGKPLLQMEDERGTTADCVSLAASRAIFKCMVKPAENGDVPVADGGIAVYTAFEVQRNFINVFTVYGVREKDTVDAARAEKDLENRCLDVGSLCWRGFTAHYERIERRQSAAGEA